jgi:hypothetical protein
VDTRTCPGGESLAPLNIGPGMYGNRSSKNMQLLFRYFLAGYEKNMTSVRNSRTVSFQFNSNNYRAIWARNIKFRMKINVNITSRCGSASIVTRLRAGWPGNRGLISGGSYIFLFFTVNNPALGPTQPRIKWVLGALFPVVKWHVHEANQLTSF